jgi:hypothetical protein
VHAMHGRVRPTFCCDLTDRLRLSPFRLQHETLCCCTLCSHVTLTPDHQQSIHCGTRGQLGTQEVDIPDDTFPCGASAWRRAVYILSRQHLGLSLHPSTILSQVVLLTGLALAVVDLLKVWPR